LVVVDGTPRNTAADIIAERLAAKTRRFTRGRLVPAPIPTTNRFAAVAGEFFFPLLREFDRPRGTLDMLARDAVVLAPFVRTLGTVMQAAGPAPATRRMGTAFLAFWCTVRYHGEANVRRALLMALAAMFEAAGAYVYVV